jgi:hypothetical protein
VEIADVPAALKKVQSFIVILTRGQQEWSKRWNSPHILDSNLHPWIWDAAGSLRDDGHMREAVQAAAVALFDYHLPAKLEVAAARSAADLVTQAFSADPPTVTHPRLRLADYPDS